jgi:hypothetical protein
MTPIHCVSASSMPCGPLTWDSAWPRGSASPAALPPPRVAGVRGCEPSPTDPADVGPRAAPSPPAAPSLAVPAGVPGAPVRGAELGPRPGLSGCASWPAAARGATGACCELGPGRRTACGSSCDMCCCSCATSCCCSARSWPCCPGVSSERLQLRDARPPHTPGPARSLSRVLRQHAREQRQHARRYVAYVMQTALRGRGWLAWPVTRCEIKSHRRATRQRLPPTVPPNHAPV